MSDPSPAAATVIDAVVDVIAELGLEGTSVRRVASRAGVSIGAVQHHYPTKDAMLAAAMARVEQVHRQRLAEEARQLHDRPEQVLRATVRSLVPRTAEDRSWASLWLAFVARAAVHEATATLHRETWQRAEDGLAWLVSGCSPAGPGVRAPSGAGSEPPDGAGSEPPGWAREAAAELLSLADGLAIAVLLEPGRMPPLRARRLVDEAVDRALARVGP